jgi:pyruvate formate lyase activating enzyme
MNDQRDTTADDLLRAAAIGREAGLRYIYAGNLPGRVKGAEDTHCAQCGETLIRRYGYLIEDYRLTPEGRCPKCSYQVPGRWAQEFDGQIASRPFLPHNRSRLFTITGR